VVVACKYSFSFLWDTSTKYRFLLVKLLYSRELAREWRVSLDGSTTSVTQ
jgi:hypothetical protein